MISLANYSKHINDPGTTFGERFTITGCPNEWVERHQAGEDHIVIVSLPNNEKIVGVFDGHGDPQCQFISYIAASIMINKLLENLEKIREGDEIKIRGIISTIFEVTNKELSDKEMCFKIKTCGTTASIALVINREDNLHLITANVGDSPIVWYSDVEVIECSLEDNCDNKEAVELYLERMVKKEISPKTVVFNRINCGGEGDPVWDANGDGNPQPLAVFDYVDGKAVLNSENYNKLVKFYPKGIQSHRYPPTITDKGVTRVKPGHESENWGSTLEGGLQLLSSLGDLRLSEHISCFPHITIKKINNSGILLLASDGFTDLCSLEEWYDHFKTLDLKDKSCSIEIENRIFSLCDDDLCENKIFSFKKIGNKRYPQWDDVSAIILPLSPYQDEEERLLELV